MTDKDTMRELIEDVVFTNFKSGLQDTVSNYNIADTAISTYLAPMNDLNYDERQEWLTDLRLKDIRKLLTLLSNKQLLSCLVDQYIERFE